jgi:hypothetical protein
LTPRIVPIVEGHGEVHSVRDLIDRVAREFWNPNEWVNVLTPFRLDKGKFSSSDHFEKAIKAASIKLGANGGAIFVLLDSDNQCPATIGPQLLARANKVCGHLRIPVSVVLAHQEYEAWFLAAAASLAGIGSLPENLEPHPNPEIKTGAKEWLNARMTDKYSPTRHQPAFTKVFDLKLARANADSFDKCCRDIERLCKELEQQNTE